MPEVKPKQKWFIENEDYSNVLFINCKNYNCQFISQLSVAFWGQKKINISIVLDRDYPPSPKQFYDKQSQYRELCEIFKKEKYKRITSDHFKERYNHTVKSIEKQRIKHKNPRIYKTITFEEDNYRLPRRCQFNDFDIWCFKSKDIDSCKNFLKIIDQFEPLENIHDELFNKFDQIQKKFETDKKNAVHFFKNKSFFSLLNCRAQKRKDAREGRKVLLQKP